MENFLFQHICSPTRIRTGQTSNILDLVFTNEEGMIITDSIKTDSPVGKSDHCMINIEFCCYIEDETFSRDRFSYFKGNYRDFSDHLNDVDWDNLFDEKSVDEMWTIFSKIMSDGMDKFIPKRKSDDRFFNPPLWMDRNTKSAIIKKRIMEIL